MELNWEAAYASRYKILTSTDGTNFTEAADVSITSPGLKTTTFTARDARYVRVLGVTRATQYGISFWDARVYGPRPRIEDAAAPGRYLGLTTPARSPHKPRCARALVVIVMLLLVSASSAAPAWAAHPSGNLGVRGLSERQLRAFEKSARPCARG